MQIDLIKLIDFLKQELQSRIQKNSMYSLRAFARDLGISASLMSKILNNKYPLKQKLAINILESLNQNLSDYQNSEFKNALEVDKNNLINIEDHDFKLICEWYHDAIIEISGLKKFSITIEDLVNILKIPEAQAIDAVDSLLNLQLIRIDQDNKIRSNLNQTNTNILDEYITSESARNQQKQILDKSKEALNQIPIQERSHTSITIKFDSNRIKEVKELITNFRLKFSQEMETENGDSVYQLQISFFPYFKNKSNTEQN